jgi:hypothetical protein
MRRFRSVLLVYAAIVSVIVLSAASASATAVALYNPLMLIPPVPDGDYTTNPPGWNSVNGLSPSELMEERNPTSTEFASAAGDNPLPSPLGIVTAIYNGATTNTLYGGALPAPALGSQALFNASTANNDIAVLSDVSGRRPLPCK